MSDISAVASEGLLLKRKRIPLKCDGGRPCKRCAQNRLNCEFAERPKDPVIKRFETLENDVVQMQQRLDAIRAVPVAATTTNCDSHFGYTASHAVRQESLAAPIFIGNLETMSTKSSARLGIDFASSPSAATTTAVTRSATTISWLQDANLSDQNLTTPRSPFDKVHKRKWHGFELSVAPSGDFVARGLVSEDDARYWFDCFFCGCDRFVPAFSADHDTYTSVRARSALLFDTIITFGSRGADGPTSRNCQRLLPMLRERLSLQVLAISASPPASMAAIQSLLVHACYSDNGWLLNSAAMRIALEADLPESVEKLLTKVMNRKATMMAEVDIEERTLFQMMRIFLALFNVEQILSLDGEKTPSIVLTTSPRRLRLMCGHILATSNDLRLFAQVELNAMRVATAGSFPAVSLASDAEDVECSINSAVRGAVIDLDLWIDDWTRLVTDQVGTWSSTEISLTLLNMRIQHEWALMTLHLHALSASGIENIAVMTEYQHAFTLAAKAAADRHLDLMLTRTTTTTPDNNHSTQSNERSYLSAFRYAMDFVWAKCAVSVLLVLRLGILLQDPISRLLERVEKARDLLDELGKVGGAEVRYYRILALVVEKCERALKEMQDQQPGYSATQPGNEITRALDGEDTTATMRSNGEESEAGREFTSYVPQEFLFEWHFPGLNLCYAPINWQDLFADF